MLIFLTIIFHNVVQSATLIMQNAKIFNKCFFFYWSRLKICNWINKFCKQCFICILSNYNRTKQQEMPKLAFSRIWDFRFGCHKPYFILLEKYFLQGPDPCSICIYFWVCKRFFEDLSFRQSGSFCSDNNLHLHNFWQDVENWRVTLIWVCKI